MQKLLFSIFACVAFIACNESKSLHQDDLPTMPAGKAAYELMRIADPATGSVPTAGPYKVLQQLEAAGKISLLQHATHKTGLSIYGWQPVNDFFATLAVTKMVYDPSDPQLFYFCTGEGWYNADAVRGAGVWKSTDAGETWSQLPATDTALFYRCQDIGVHPTNGDIYVATRGESFGSADGGLYRSQDGGDSWQKVLGQNVGAIKNSVADIEFTANGGIFTTIGIFESDGVYYSPSGDTGSWSQVNNGLPPANIERIEIATAPSNDSVAYLIAQDGSDDSIAGVFKTTDLGQNWTACALPGGNRNLARVQGWYDLSLGVDPNNSDVVAVGGLNIFRSRDGGASWEQMTHRKRDSIANIDYMHVDQHEITFLNSDTVFFGNDGGVWRSDNFQDTIPHFYEQNNTYNITQFYAGAISAVAGSHVIIGGTQDNGSNGSSGHGVSDFVRLTGADGAFCAIDQTDENVMYTTKQYERTYRFTAGINGPFDTITNPYIGKNASSGTLFINPIALDSKHDVLYQATSKGLWRLSDASTAIDSSWTKCTRTWGAISAIGIAQDVDHVLFFGRRAGIGNLFRVVNSNTTDQTYLPESADPFDMLPRVTSGTVWNSCIYVDPQDGNHVLSVYSNYGVNSIWQSTNALSPNPEWYSVEGNLPDIPVRWAVLHPQNSNVCYVATEVGVFYTTMLQGDSTDWNPLNNGLANVRTDMLQVRASDNTILAATHGRGLYTGKIKSDYTIDWVERGPKNVGGRTRSIVIDPNDPTGKKMWAAGVSGGLWFTNNIDSIDYEIPDPIIPPPLDPEISVYPNPFGSQGTTIQVGLAKPGHIELTIFDLNGRIIQQFIRKNQPAGYHKFTWNPSQSLSRGLYLVDFWTDGNHQTKRLMLMGE
jgi:photosystem II stability/assembly factor-like uncharacterized protein